MTVRQLKKLDEGDLIAIDSPYRSGKLVVAYKGLADGKLVAHDGTSTRFYPTEWAKEAPEGAKLGETI